MVEGDKYREANTNKVAFLFTKGFSKSATKWIRFNNISHIDLKTV